MESAIILYCHGSPWPDAYASIERAMEQLKSDGAAEHVRMANLQMRQPFLEDVIADLSDQGVGSFVVVPMLLSSGRHVKEDVPKAVRQAREAFPDVTIEVTLALGDGPGLSDFLKSLLETRSEI